MNQRKKALTINDQISLLRQRGCIINDYDKCKIVLENISYYRLSAYFLPFKLQNGDYAKGTSIDKIFSIYEFDRELRTLFLSAVEIIEISIRAKIANYYALKYDPYSYIVPDNFNNNHNPKNFKANLERAIRQNENSQFVKHYNKNYNGEFPIWVAVELFTMGMLSRFYSDLTTKDKKELMGKQYSGATSWLRCCTDLRNICAHYGRLYYRKFPAIPKGFKLDKSNERALWASLLCIRELYPSAEQWNEVFVKNLQRIIKKYEATIELTHIGFPDDWSITLIK